MAVDLAPEIEYLFLGQAPLDEGARVNPRGRMALDVDDVAAVALGWRAPEMAEADIVQGSGGLEARDMAAELGGVLVGAHHHRERVPADHRADAPFDLAIAGVVRLAIGGDRVEVRA